MYLRIRTVCVTTKALQLALAMYCIHREDTPDKWIQDLCFKTELRAFVRARVMSRVNNCNYRVVDQASSNVIAVLRQGKGSVL
jgi:hypothetical protein